MKDMKESILREIKFASHPLSPQVTCEAKTIIFIGVGRVHALPGLWVIGCLYSSQESDTTRISSCL